MLILLLVHQYQLLKKLYHYMTVTNIDLDSPIRKSATEC